MQAQISHIRTRTAHYIRCPAPSPSAQAPSAWAALTVSASCTGTRTRASLSVNKTTRALWTVPAGRPHSRASCGASQDGVYFGVVSLLLPDRLTAEHILTPSDTDGATLSSGCKAAAQMNGVCARVGKAAAGAHEDEKHAVLVAQCNDRSLQPHAPERSSVSHARQAVRTGRCQPRGRTAGATRTSAGLAAIALIAATPPCGHSVRGFSPADELCAAADADAATGRHTPTAPRASAETTRPLSVCEMATHHGSACRARCRATARFRVGALARRAVDAHQRTRSTLRCMQLRERPTARGGKGMVVSDHLVCRVHCDALHESGRYEQIGDR